MGFMQYIEWNNGNVSKYNYINHSQEEVIEILKQDINERDILSTWLEDRKGKQLVYFDKNTKSINGDDKLKKETKEEVLNKVYVRVPGNKKAIKDVLDSLEEQGYIKFKKELKTYKVFVKIVTIDGENKKLYYITDLHLTDNIDEAKRFEVDEEKDGYAYEFVKE